jgi:hypothetical protein
MMPDDMGKGGSRQGAGGGEMARTMRDAEASRKSVRDAAEASARTASRSLEASREMVRGSEAIGKTAERASEAFSRIASDTADTSQQVAERSAEQFSQMFIGRFGDYQEIFLHAQRNLDVLMQVGGVVVGGLPSIVREWTDYAQRAVQCNIDGVNGMMRARTVQDLASAQSDLLTSEIQLLLDSGARISEATACLARDAAQSIDDRTQQARRR